MASVHLSVSEHSQLSSLSTGQVIPCFLSPLHHSPLCPLLLQPFLQSHLSASSCLFIIPSYFFSISLPFFPSTPSISIPSSLSALHGIVHSATKQSCLQHHTLAIQARRRIQQPSNLLSNTIIMVILIFDIYKGFQLLGPIHILEKPYKRVQTLQVKRRAKREQEGEALR